MWVSISIWLSQMCIPENLPTVSRENKDTFMCIKFRTSVLLIMYLNVWQQRKTQSQVCITSWTINWWKRSLVAVNIHSHRNAAIRIDREIREWIKRDTTGMCLISTLFSSHIEIILRENNNVMRHTGIRVVSCYVWSRLTCEWSQDSE